MKAIQDEKSTCLLEKKRKEKNKKGKGGD